MKHQQQQSESILYDPKERNKDIASLQRLYLRCGLCVFFWVLRLAIEWWVLPQYKLGEVSGAVLLALCTVQLIWNAIKTKAATGLNLVTMVLLVVVGIMSAISVMESLLGYLLIHVLAIIIYFMYFLFLFCAITNRLTVTNERQHDPLFDILLLVCATITSMMFLVKRSETSPSDTSFYWLLASLLWYVHATLMASRVLRPRGATGDPTMILHSSNAVSFGICRNDGVVTMSFMPLLGTLAIACLFLHVWPKQSGEYTDLALEEAFYDCCFPIIWVFFEFLGNGPGPTTIMACQFHVRSDASILVETVYKTYLYEKVVRAELEPRFAKFPKQSEMYHVYSERLTDIRRVVIELTEGRWLLINPENPRAFVDAIARAVEQQGKKSSMHP